MDFYGGWKKSFGDFGIDVGYLYYYYDTARWNGTTQGSATANNTSGRYDNGELYFGASWKWLSAKYSYSTTNYFGLNGDQARAYFTQDCTRGFNCTGARAGALSANNENRGNSKGTQYFQLDASYEVAPKWTVSGHVGHTTVKNYGELSYTDYKVGVTYDLSGWMLGAAVVGTNANKQWYYNARTVGGSLSTKNTGDTTLVLSVSKTF